ncbi:hypothetical protein M433DRAFT_277870 [Acidomyces richmondensis BFW]|nr:hypothetical protein M433DRAFT_277870 [Acidomyces richmondensis BFW]
MTRTSIRCPTKRTTALTTILNLLLFVLRSLVIASFLEVLFKTNESHFYHHGPSIFRQMLYLGEASRPDLLWVF